MTQIILSHPDAVGTAGAPFTTTTSSGPGVRTVYVAGDLDLNADVRSLAVFCDGQGLPIVVDATDLDFMDCGGYRAIAAARRTAERHHTTLTVANAHGAPARFLRLLDELGLL